MPENAMTTLCRAVPRSLALCATALGLALLADPVAAQSIDDWGGALTEIVPQEPQQEGDTTPDVPAADMTAGHAPLQGTAEIPEGWHEQARFGLTVAVPPEFEMLDDTPEEVMLGDFDFNTETGMAVTLLRGRHDDILGEAEIITQDTVQLADGAAFTLVELAVEDSAFNAVALALLEHTEIPGEETAAVMVTLFNMGWDDETRPLAERILASVAPLAPAPDRAVALDGTLAYVLPEGWQVQRERDNFIELLHGGMSGPVLAIATGEPGRDMTSLTARVFGERAVMRDAFTESMGTILGQPARVFEGASAWVSGWQSHLHVLEACAPGNNPVSILSVLAAEEQQAQIDALIEHMTLRLPDGMAACPEALAPGTVWARDGRFAIAQIEGLSGYQNPHEIGVEPSDRDERFPSMAVTADRSAFDTTFQLDGPLGLGFAEPPRVERSTLHGHGAHRFIERGEVSDRGWSLRAYLLDTCLPDDVPVIVALRRESSDALADADPDPMLEQVFLDLPEGSRPCPAELLDEALARVQARPADVPEATRPPEPEDQRAPAVPDAAPAAQGWTRYVNARFGTAVEYPADLFTALPPPANEDGRAFETADNAARFRVFAGHNVFEQSLFELMVEASDSDTMGRITRADLMDDRAIVAGERDGRAHVRVMIAEPEAGIIHTLLIDHDAASARFAPIVERMTESFTVDVAAPAAEADPADDTAQDDVERVFWESIAASEDPAEFRAYLELWPQGRFAALAEARLRQLAQETPPARADAPAEPNAAPDATVELTFWQSIAGSQDPADFEAYLERWPQGDFAALARNRLRQLAGPDDAPPAPAHHPSGPDAGLPPPPPADPAAYETPAPDSRERAAIMDAARVPVADGLGQRVIFVVSTLRRSGPWAYLAAVPHQPDGRALDWTQTPFRDAWLADAMSDLVLVLLVDDGSGWRALRHVIGPTDVAWYDWVDELGLPVALFFDEPDRLP